MGGSMRRHFTSVLIRNERGAEIWDAASDRMETSEAVSGRDFLRPLFVKATMTQDDDVADTKLLPATTSGTFRLKFLGPLALSEGRSTTFDIQLDSKPTADVRIAVPWVAGLRVPRTGMAHPAI